MRSPVPQWMLAPLLLQIDKALMHQWRPNTVKNKINNKIIFKKCIFLLPKYTSVPERELSAGIVFLRFSAPYIQVQPCFQFSSMDCEQDWFVSVLVSSVQLLSHVRLFVTLWTAARQVSLSIANSWSSPKLICIELMIPSSHLILCHPLLLLPPIPPSNVSV